MPEDLKPCPMCGKAVAKVTTSSEMFPEQDDEGNSESYAVVCDAHMPNGPGGCGASGGFALTEDHAIAAWNRRAPAQPEPLPALPEDVVMVPRSALRWLFGEEGEFECPPNRYFRGKPPTYWWRGVFRELIAKTAQPEPAAPTVVEPIGWLIEHSGKFPGAEDGMISWLYVKLKDGGYGTCEFGFTHDSNEALRFSRKEDAEAVMKMHLGAQPPKWYSELYSVAEHMWPAATPPRAPLTDEQIDSMWRVSYRERSSEPESAFDWFEAGVKAAEAAHRIGGPRNE